MSCLNTGIPCWYNPSGFSSPTNPPPPKLILPLFRLKTYPSPVPFFYYRSPHWAGSIFLFPGVHRLVQQRSPSFVPQRSGLALPLSPGGRCNYSAGLPLFQGLTDLFLSEVYTRNTLSCSVLSHLFQNFQSYYPTADLSSFPPRARDSKA